MGCPFACTFITGQLSTLPRQLWAERTLSTLTIVAPITYSLYFKMFSIAKCIEMLTNVLKLNNHSERWITRLANRWRAQQSAITIANCRIYWAAITWTQIAASGIPGATFAWGSTIITKPLTGIVYMSVGNWAFAFFAFVYKALCGLKNISKFVLFLTVYVSLTGQFLLNIYLSFNDLRRAGLPAEFKHITKRRKRK